MNIKRRHILHCPYGTCRASVNPSNAATNFTNPALSVKIAVSEGIIRARQRVLEFGPGNLRNALFILDSVPDIHLHTYDLQGTISRFPEKYRKFRKLGGSPVNLSKAKRAYDIVICTFVLETICPEQKRRAALKSIARILRKKGALIASFRGYSGVVGSKYRKCPMGEGLVSPLNTFIRPYSVSELGSFLHSCGFERFNTLQNYKVDTPKNIHLMAFAGR